VAAWVDAVTEGRYTPGVYCWHAIASDVHLLRAAVNIWAFEVPTTDLPLFAETIVPDADPSGCGFAQAALWQMRRNCKLSVPLAPVVGLLVDLGTALTADPNVP
jgi:hypothetical protein